MAPTTISRALVLLASLAAIACSGPTEATGPVPSGGSPCTTAPACPDGGVPSYNTDIVRILDQNCVPCHGPGGIAGDDESNYAGVKKQFTAMLSFVNECKMPPVDGPQMSAADRVALTAWLRCGAPDN